MCEVGDSCNYMYLIAHTLLELYVISLKFAISTESDQPAHPCSLSPGSILLADPLQSSNLDIPRIDNGQFQI